MNKTIVVYLLCPNCFFPDLELRQYVYDQDYVQEGILICRHCNVWYRIEKGIVDFLMKIWRLYDEKAAKEPLLSEQQLKKWFSNAGLDSKIEISTYIPPHIFYLLDARINIFLLRLSDRIFNKIPLVKNLGGVIIAEGIKANN